MMAKTAAARIIDAQNQLSEKVTALLRTLSNEHVLVIKWFKVHVDRGDGYQSCNACRMRQHLVWVMDVSLDRASLLRVRCRGPRNSINYLFIPISAIDSKGGLEEWMHSLREQTAASKSEYRTREVNELKRLMAKYPAEAVR